MKILWLWLALTAFAEEPKFHVEVYDPNLPLEGMKQIPETSVKRKSRPTGKVRPVLDRSLEERAQLLELDPEIARYASSVAEIDRDLILIRAQSLEPAEAHKRYPALSLSGWQKLRKKLLAP